MRKLAWGSLLLLAILPCLSFAEAKVENKLLGLKVLPLPDDRVRLILQFEKPLAKKPTGFVMNKPATLVFDFPNVKDALAAEFRSKTLSVGVLRKYHLVNAPERLRAIFSLQTVVSYTTQITGSQLNITLSGGSDRNRFVKTPAQTTKKVTNARYAIQDVDFRGAGKNGGKLVIKLSDPNLDVDVSQLGEKIVLKFANTRVPGKYLRRIDVADFNSPAQAVDVYQKGDSAQVVVQNKGEYGQFAYQVNQDFFVEVFRLTPEEVKRAKRSKQVFTGKPISLNFQNISVRAVLQLIAEFTSRNIVVSDGVQGNITLRLNRVPWDQVLSIIMKTRGLSKRQTGDVLLIAPSVEIAAREKAELAAREQSTELAPLLSELLQINYAKASEIAGLLSSDKMSMLSSRGSLSVDARTNSIWIQDTAAKLGDIQELIHKLDVPVRQVLIEARIVIVNTDFEQDLGIRFGVTHPDYASGTLAGANEIRGGTAPTGTTTDAFGEPANRLNIDLPAASAAANAGRIGLALARLGPDILLDLELSAIETAGKGEVISSPRLITANQQEAVIKSGEEIPYLEASSSGAATIAFKQAVLSLQVTPQITPDNNIILDLKVNQDTASSQLFNGVPAIITKQVETNVLVSNGQTVVLGGIYMQESTTSVNRVPFLGQMPFIGPLFRNTQTVNDREELLVFITPKIIKHSFMSS